VRLELDNILKAAEKVNAHYGLPQCEILPPNMTKEQYYTARDKVLGHLVSVLFGQADNNNKSANSETIE
jgi:hypothetical protein